MRLSMLRSSSSFAEVRRRTRHVPRYVVDWQELVCGKSRPPGMMDSHMTRFWWRFRDRRLLHFPQEITKVSRPWARHIVSDRKALDTANPAMTVREQKRAKRRRPMEIL